MLFLLKKCQIDKYITDMFPEVESAAGVRAVVAVDVHTTVGAAASPTATQVSGILSPALAVVATSFVVKSVKNRHQSWL